MKITAMKLKLIFILFASALEIALISCKDDSVAESTGTVQITFQKSVAEGSRVLESQRPKALFITIADETGNAVFSLKKLPLVKVGDEYITESIELHTGIYTITDFIVTDENDSTLYLAPKEGSELAYLVTKPLPIPFEVVAGITSSLMVEVVEASKGDAAQFGYFTFGFEVIKEVVLKLDSGLGQDAYVNSYYPSLTLGERTQLQSAAWTISGGRAILRSYLDFNIASITDIDEVVKADLYLFEDHTDRNFSEGHSQLSGSNASLIRLITSDWSENSISWETRPSIEDSLSVTIPRDTSATQDFVIDVSVLIQQTLMYPERYFGLSISLKNENPYRTMLFASKEHPDPNKRPKLIIRYKKKLD